MSAYYVRSQGKVLGPFSFEDLKAKAAKGHLKKTHQVSTDKKTWQAARAVEGLFPPPPKAPEPAKAEPVAPVLVEPELVEVRLIEDEPLEVGLSEEQTEWHYCLQGDEQTQGPVSEAKLKKLLQSGRLPADTMVWNDTLSDWVEAARIPALSPGPARGEAGPVVFSEVPIIDTGPAFPAAVSNKLPVPPMASASLILGLLGIVISLIAVSIVAATGFKNVVLGVMGIVIPGGIASGVAIVFGHLALGQIKANRRVFQGENLARTGLIIGYVLLAILILAGSGCLMIKLAKS